jgi:hypothetical protein
MVGDAIVEMILDLVLAAQMMHRRPNWLKHCH